MCAVKKSDNPLEGMADNPEKLSAFLAKIPLTREGLTALMNLSGQKNGWGQITTTTTIGDLATNGLPRRKSGRSYFYSLADFAAFLAWRSKNREERGGNDAKRFQAEKLKEELRRLKRENDREDGILVNTEQLEEEWKVAAGVVNSRLQTLADRLRSGALTGEDAAISLEGMSEEMVEAVERALAKHTRKAKKK